MSDEKKSEVVQYKVSDETKRRAQAAFDASGIDEKGEFYIRLLSLFELQQQRDGSSGYKEQIDELEYHGRRIVELYLSMIQTEASKRMDMTQQHEEKFLRVSNELSLALDEILEHKGTIKLRDGLILELTTSTENLVSTIKQFEALRKKDEELAEAHKKQIGELSSLLSDQKSAADAGRNALLDADQLRKEVESLRELVDRGSRNLEETKAQFVLELKNIDEKHKNELEKLSIRATLDKERAVLEVEKRIQSERAIESAENAERIRKLYDQLEMKNNQPSS